MGRRQRTGRAQAGSPFTRLVTVSVVAVLVERSLRNALRGFQPPSHAPTEPELCGMHCTEGKVTVVAGVPALGNTAWLVSGMRRTPSRLDPIAPRSTCRLAETPTPTLSLESAVTWHCMLKPQGEWEGSVMPGVETGTSSALKTRHAVRRQQILSTAPQEYAVMTYKYPES